MKFNNIAELSQGKHNRNTLSGVLPRLKPEIVKQKKKNCNRTAICTKKKEPQRGQPKRVNGLKQFTCTMYSCNYYASIAVCKISVFYRARIRF